MKILIIGGTGLISTGITRELVARGDDVTLYNRGLTEAPVPEGCERITGDRTDLAMFEAQMAEAGTYDCVIDMICFHPDEAESAMRAFHGRTAQYIFCSTVDVYTKPASRYPICEDAERHPERSFPYAFDKAICERSLMAAHEREGFPVTLIRPAHTYGPGGGLIHTLGFQTYYLDRLRKGQPIIVHGDGSSLWSSCHRDDVAHAFVGAVGNESACGKAYHVTGEEWMTWDQYHQGVARAMGWPEPVLVHIPTDLLGRAVPRAAEWCVENFSHNNLFDNSAARADLGFRYTISWQEGVPTVVAWLEERGKIESSSAYPLYDRILDAWARLGEGMVAELEGVES